MKRILLVGICLVVIWLLGHAPSNQISFLDVGQGLSLLFTDNEGWQLLFDGGPGNAVLPPLAQEMSPLDQTIDVIALSHTHRDHLEGLISVLKRYHVKEVWWSGAEAHDDVFAAWQAAVEQSGAKVTIITTGWTRYLASGWKIAALHPNADENGTHPHDHDLVFLMTRDQQSILLTGDLEAKNEQAILQFCQTTILVHCQEPNIWLQVSHHGARTTTSNEWLDYFQPQQAVISVGTGNTYGHPHQETLDRLSAHNIPIFRTDQLGTVTWQLDARP